MKITSCENMVIKIGHEWKWLQKVGHEWVWLQNRWSQMDVVMKNDGQK